MDFLLKLDFLDHLSYLPVPEATYPNRHSPLPCFKGVESNSGERQLIVEVNSQTGKYSCSTLVSIQVIKFDKTVSETQ